jgi:hypothetical protein
MQDATFNHASELDGHERKPSPVRDPLDDIDYDLDYELALDDYDAGDGG